MARSSTKKYRSRDLLALLILSLAILLIFLPALTEEMGIFHDDQAMAEFPWHFFLARHFQEGRIPLWEPDTWCGAIPFYARYYADTYYFPLWPFYLLTNTNNLQQAYWVLSLIPLLLHYLLAGIGMFLLGRLGLKLKPGGALVGAWIYVFSPAFSYSYVWFPIVAVQAWLPWLLLAVCRMVNRFNWSRVLAAAAIIALMIMAAQPPHVGYALLLGSLLASALAIRIFKTGPAIHCLRAPGQLVMAITLGLFLSAVFWLPAWEGSTYTEQHLPMTYEAMTGQDGSMPPIYLATIFNPDLFGTVTGFNNHNWVESITHGVRFWDANLSGGLFLTFLALAGIYLSFRLKTRRFWAIFSGFLWIFAILCALGRHTPFYWLFFKCVPGLNIFPFPIRYRLLQVIATAWLAGIGADLLWEKKNSLLKLPAKLVWGYIALAGTTCLMALAGGGNMVGGETGRKLLPGLAEIIRKGNLEWFLSSPVLYFFASCFCLVLIWRGLRGKLRGILALGLVLVEVFLVATAVFYFCIFRYHVPQPQQERSLHPGKHPMVRRILGPVKFLRDDKNLRWATDQPFHDNFSRLDVDGSYAFLGYDMKPLEKRFRETLTEAYQQPIDWPIYWDKLLPKSGAFLSNMSVGYLLDSRPGNLFGAGDTIQLDSDPAFYFHHNPSPLPRTFTLDKVVIGSEDEIRQQLTGGDLKSAIFIEEGSDGITKIKEKLKTTAYSDWLDLPEKSNIYFEQFQSANPITQLNLSNPNQILVKVELNQPAILGLTETWYPGWKAKANGKEVPIIRINYLQRGILLPAGKHQVKLEFSPRAWQIGTILSLSSWSLLFLFFMGRGIAVLIKRK